MRLWELSPTTLSSARWRTRKADGMIQCKSTGLRTGELQLRLQLRLLSQGIWRSKNQELWYLRAGKDGYLSSRSKRICPSFIFLLHLGPLWIGWCPSILVRVDLDSVYWINIFGKVFWLIPATRLEFAPAENSWKASQMGKLYGESNSGQVRETWLSVSVKFLNHFS